jgi:hypothetical protein
MNFTITQVVQRTPGQWNVIYTDGSEQRETALPDTAIAWRMAEYGISDPAAALLAALHEPHLWELMADLANADDPAAVAGWVTTTGPDAEPIHVHTARSTRDARGAHEARLAAVRKVVALTDPDRLLAPLADALRPRPADLAALRERVDTARWTNVYGALPTPPARPEPRRIPMQQEG